MFTIIGHIKLYGCISVLCVHQGSFLVYCLIFLTANADRRAVSFTLAY